MKRKQKFTTLLTSGQNFFHYLFHIHGYLFHLHGWKFTSYQYFSHPCMGEMHIHGYVFYCSGQTQGLAGGRLPQIRVVGWCQAPPSRRWLGKRQASAATCLRSGTLSVKQTRGHQPLDGRPVATLNRRTIRHFFVFIHISQILNYEYPRLWFSHSPNFTTSLKIHFFHPSLLVTLLG